MPTPESPAARCPRPDGSLCGTCPDCVADAANDAQWGDGGIPPFAPERPAAFGPLSRDDRAFLEAWLVGADFPMAPVVRRLLEAYDDRVEALAMLRSAWNVHMETCEQFKRLPDLPAPSWEDLQAWRDAPSGTASA